MIHFACLCLTYHRPQLIRSAIESFNRQDYPASHRELVILDDGAGYADGLCGPGWRLWSVGGRYSTLGDKRNAAASLASLDADAFAVWDDDDIYLPWHLSAAARALESAPWSRPARCLVEHHRFRPLEQKDCGTAYHAGWAYTREAFDAAGGYPPHE